MEAQELLALTHHPAGSRVLDAVIDGATTPPRARRTLLRAMEAHFADVIDDRIGARVGARCWAAADPYLKVCKRRLRFDLTDADIILFFRLRRS